MQRDTRAEREERMSREFERALQGVDINAHPLPWVWGISYHDGLFFQFFDANGGPCLGNDLRDPEDAAYLFAMINRLK